MWLSLWAAAARGLSATVLHGNPLMARLLGFLLALLAPVLARAGVQVFGRMPAWPFLALTPARTAVGRSVSVALLVAGLLGLTALQSLSTGSSLLVAAYALAAIVAIGCGRAFATFWWPAALGAALVGMGIGLAVFPRVSPWAMRIDDGGAQPVILLVGGFGVVWIAFLATGMTIGALQQLESSEGREDS